MMYSNYILLVVKVQVGKTTMESTVAVLTKLNRHLPFDLAFLLLGINSVDVSAYITKTFEEYS